MTAFEPFQPHSFFCQPFQVGGQTPGGVWLENEYGESLHDRRLPAIFSRVTKVHPTCTEVRVGDWIVHPANRPVRNKTRNGTIYSLNESAVLGVVQAADGEPWF